jgi:hypothetical protein
MSYIAVEVLSYLRSVFMYRLCCFLSCLLSFGALGASVAEQLKKVEGKSAHHCMRNIDFIYIINLDERPEKWASCIQQLLPYGIEPFRFSAINGWKLSNEVLDSVGVKYKPGMPEGWMATCFLPNKHIEEMHVPGRGYIHSTMQQGAVGCILSHLSVLKDAWDSGYKTIWVMEDDIKVLQDPHILSELIDKLDSAVGEDGWDLLYTDVNLGGGTMARPNPRKLDVRQPPVFNGFELEFRLVGSR